MKRLMGLVVAASVLMTLGGCVYGPGYYQRPGVVYDDGADLVYSDGYSDAPGYYGGGYGGYYSPGYGYGYYGGPYIGLGFSGNYYYGGHRGSHGSWRGRDHGSHGSRHHGH